MAGIEELEKFNPWWKTGKVKDEWLKEYKRKLYSDVHKYVEKRQALLVWGLRRVGKTVLLFQIIQELLGRTNAKNVLYFSFDEALFDMKDVLESYQKLILNKTFGEMKEKVYLFLDEVQKVKDWESKIKVYYDLYPNLKFFLSGSASAKLRRGSKESLAGRLFDFLMKPLDFEEFIELSGKDLKKIKEKPDLWKREIVPLFYKYIKYGMFPELVGEQDDEFARKYLLNNVIERVVYKDLPEEFSLNDIELLKSLTYLVGQKPGMIINYKEIAKNLGRDQRTIANYFEYLEFGLLVAFAFNYRGSPLASLRKLKKAYFTTPNLIFAFGQSLDTVLPMMLENLVMAETGARFFYKNSFEIDFVIPSDNSITAIEVKKGGKETKQIKKFTTIFKKARKSFIVTLEEERKEKNISIMPAWKFLLLKPYKITKH